MKSKQIKRALRNALSWLHVFGIDPQKFIRSVKEFPTVLKEYFILKKQFYAQQETTPQIFFNTPYFEKSQQSGTASGHYFHTDLLVAQKVFQRNPIKHVDVGSRVDGFVAHVATFRQIEVLDIRPQVNRIKNVIFRQCDLMNLSEDFNGYCDSLSCLHALEHFGLGRYGDNIDINGHIRGFDNLCKMLKYNGYLYLSVPIGTERIEFNGLRVFSIKTVLSWTKDSLELTEFSYVDDHGNLHHNVILEDDTICSSFDQYYGCGIFQFRRI
jgi:hypothetical protein